MAITLNETHDPARRSFVESANLPGSDFPIQNLPFGVFRLGPGAQPRVGVADRRPDRRCFRGGGLVRGTSRCGGSGLAARPFSTR